MLVEAEFPADIVDARLNQAVIILEDLLKQIVSTLISSFAAIILSVLVCTVNMVFSVLLTVAIVRMSPWTTTRSNN